MPIPLDSSFLAYGAVAGGTTYLAARSLGGELTPYVPVLVMGSVLLTLYYTGAFNRVAVSHDRDVSMQKRGRMSKN